MKILHTSDNHLSTTAYSKLDPETGLNARSIDYLNSFKSVCKIALNERVDVFCIAGDLFNNANVPHYHLLEVIRMLRRLSKTGIMTLVVSGNNDRVGGTINPLAFLKEIDNVYIATEPNTFVLGSYDFVCIPAPSTSDPEKEFNNMLANALERSTSSNKILLSHVPLKGAVKGSEEVVEGNIPSIDPSVIPDIFSYAALGHMHKFQQIQHDVPIFYSGSSERFDFSEENEEKYALIIELEEAVRVKPVRLPIRSMVTVANIDCTNLSASEVTSKVVESINTNVDRIKNALVRLILNNLNAEYKDAIGWEEISSKLTESKVFDYISDLRIRDQVVEKTSIVEPEKELEMYIKKHGYDAKLLRMGREIIRRVNRK